MQQHSRGELKKREKEEDREQSCIENSNHETEWWKDVEA